MIHLTFKSGLPSLALALTLALASCGTLKPLKSDYASVDPQPLELRGGKIPATITLNIPAKWFNKNAVVRITPVLKHGMGQQWGTAYTFQGEKVRGNARTVSYSNPATLTLNSDFNWSPEYRNSELFLMFNATVNGKEVSLPDLKIGEGVLATEALASANDVTPAIAPDGFQRVIKEKFDTDIHFLIQQANLRSSELKSGDLKAWKEIIENADYAPNQNVDVEVQAYASPDGGLELNEKLAAQREKNTSDYLKRELKRMDVDAPVSAYYTAQDWEGFKELVEASDLQDKDLVLRVLSMYPDPEVREKEIKNISAVYSQLTDLILPKLRRSRLIANIETIGKSDAEILDIARVAPGRLTNEELLYAATLTKDTEEKISFYNSATSTYPKDYRAYNNLAALAFEVGNIGKAEELLQKASEVAMSAGEKNPEALLLNQSLLQLRAGNVDQAKTLLGQISDLPNVNEAMGLLHIQDGNYSMAAKELRDTPTNNGVLAQILDKNYARATELLGLISEPDATTHYLKAIIGARTGDTALIQEGLSEAIHTNPDLRSILMADREFAKYRTAPFLAPIFR